MIHQDFLRFVHADDQQVIEDNLKLVPISSEPVRGIFRRYVSRSNRFLNIVSVFSRKYAILPMIATSLPPKPATTKGVKTVSGIH